MFRRDFHTTTVTIPINTALSNAFDFKAFSMLIVGMPAAWTAARVGFKVAPTSTGTFLPLTHEDGTIVEIVPTVDRAHVAPVELASCAGWVRLWSQNGSFSDTNQDAERTLIVYMKA